MGYNLPPGVTVNDIPGNRPEDDEPEIEEHPDWPEVIDEIAKYGNWTKEQLVFALYEESGEGETKKQLRQQSRGELLARLIDDLHGGTCQ